VNSIRLRLLSWLLACVALVALAAGWGVYRAALLDADTLFDYQLRQLALSLRDQGVAQGLAGPGESYEVVVQIWDDSGERIYLSHPYSDLPQRATLGFEDVSSPSGGWRVYSVQMHGHTIQVAQPLGVRRELARAHALRTLVPVLVLLPLLAAALWFGADRALRPLLAMARELRARDPALLAPLADEGREAEIRPLVRALNDLLRRLAAALERQRAFVADAAHELRSPLTALKIQVQLLERAPDAAGRRNAGEQLASGIERASHLVEQLLTLARNDADSGGQPFVPVALGDAVREAIAEVAPLADARGVDLGLAGAEEVSVRGDAEALRILVRNLADNGVRYTPRGGRVDASVRAHGQEAVIEVADTGPGIPAAERARVFSRFYRGRVGEESGSGLGLAIVKAIAESHGGRVELASAPSGGLLVRAILPREMP